MTINTNLYIFNAILVKFPIGVCEGEKIQINNNHHNHNNNKSRLKMAQKNLEMIKLWSCWKKNIKAFKII